MPVRVLEQDAATSGPCSNTEEMAHEDIDETKSKHDLEENSTMWDSQVVDKDGELNDTIYDDSQPIDYEADNSER